MTVELYSRYPVLVGRGGSGDDGERWERMLHSGVDPPPAPSSPSGWSRVMVSARPGLSTSSLSGTVRQCGPAQPVWTERAGSVLVMSIGYKNSGDQKLFAD